MIFKGLILKGIYGREMFETWYKMISMLQSGLDVTPVHHAPLPDRRRSRMASTSCGRGKSGKVILDWKATSS